MILDAHVHCWDAQRFRLAWSRGHARLGRTHDAEEYRAEASAAGIGPSILVEVDVAPEQRGDEAADQVARCAAGRGGAIAAVPCLDPRSASFAADARALAAMPAVRGVRWLARDDAGARALTRSAMVRANLALLGELGLAFDLNVPIQHLGELPGLVSGCPGTRFVLDHFGYADPVAFGARAERPATHDAAAWRAAIDALAASPNVSCKVSGLANRLPDGACSAGDVAPILAHARAAFGASRLIFASDWPVIGPPGTLARWVGVVRELSAAWTAAERAALFGAAARAAYAIAGGVEGRSAGG